MLDITQPSGLALFLADPFVADQRDQMRRSSSAPGDLKSHRRNRDADIVPVVGGAASIGAPEELGSPTGM